MVELPPAGELVLATFNDGRQCLGTVDNPEDVDPRFWLTNGHWRQASTMMNWCHVSVLPKTTETVVDEGLTALLLEAAELAEKAADAASGDWRAYFTAHGDPYLAPPGRPWKTSMIAEVSTGASEDYGRANCILLGASNPGHWRAVAGVLRSAAQAPEVDHSIALLARSVITGFTSSREDWVGDGQEVTG